MTAPLRPMRPATLDPTPVQVADHVADRDGRPTRWPTAGPIKWQSMWRSAIAPMTS